MIIIKTLIRTNTYYTAYDNSTTNFDSCNTLSTIMSNYLQQFSRTDVSGNYDGGGECVET